MKIRRGHLYLADLNPGRGTEAGKMRPVLVLQNDFLNETHSSTWVLPCTTRLTPENLLRVRLPKNVSGNDRDCDVMVDQSRSVDNRRLVSHLGQVPVLIMREVVEKIMLLGELR